MKQDGKKYVFYTRRRYVAAQGMRHFHHRDQNAARNILREILELAVGHTDNRNTHGATVRLAYVGGGFFIP